MKPPSFLNAWVENNATFAMYARRIQSKLRRLRHHSERIENLAMLHAGRCGSSVLADLLNQRPDFHFCGEPFEYMKQGYYRMRSNRRAEQVITDAMYRKRVHYFCFDAKYLPEQHLRPELANQTPEEFIALLRNLGFSGVILLNRQNHLRRAVSTTIGEKTKQWSSFTKQVKPVSIALSVDTFTSYGRKMKLLEFFDSIDKTHLQTLRAAENLGMKTLELEYETDIQHDPSLAYQKVCNFIDAPPFDVQIRLKKQNQQSLPELIENFSEIETLLTNTKYEWMLNQP